MFGSLDATQFLIVFGSLLVAISIHEAMHAFASYWLGDDTAKLEGRLTLNPIKHIDIYMSVILPMVLLLLRLPPIFAAKPVPFNAMRVKFEEFGVALVGLAGPLTNLALAIVAGLAFQILPQTNLTSDILVIFTRINVGLFIFNMIPIPPLDGSRLLYAFAPEPLQRLMESIEQYGILIVLALFLLLSPFISPFLISANRELSALLLGVNL